MNIMEIVAQTPVENIAPKILRLVSIGCFCLGIISIIVIIALVLIYLADKKRITNSSGDEEAKKFTLDKKFILFKRKIIIFIILALLFFGLVCYLQWLINRLLLAYSPIEYYFRICCVS